MNQTLRVSGTGRMSVKPDTIQLFLTLNDHFSTYEEAIETSALWTDQLKQAFSKKKFKKTELTTLHFSIDSHFENERDPDGQYRQKFSGYRFNHQLSIEFEADHKRLGDALTAIITSAVPVEFNIHYAVKNVKAIKEQLLQKAVSDAADTARLLALSAKVKLGKMLQIHYGKEELIFRQETMRSARFQGQDIQASLSLDIEPGELNFEETVEIIWEIS